MALIDYDPFVSITRFLDPEAAHTFIDIGANRGVTARRMIEEFPNATVYAFEPSPQIFSELQATARAYPGIKPVQLAAGDQPGVLDFHVTRNSWCSSLLKPTELGKQYYGDWYETVRTLPVQSVRLDDWCHEHGLARIDFIKVDAQGYDLKVLQGAQRMIRSGGIQAIASEFQFAPEYDGCATFSQIDAFLSEHGFAFHQMHQLEVKGAEEQTSFGDGLWLRNDVLARLRARPATEALADRTPAGRLRKALRYCEEKQLTRIGLFGAGQHTRKVLGKVAAELFEFIIDDNAALTGTTLNGRPIRGSREAVSSRPDAVILSSDSMEPALWRAASIFRDAGIEVIPLYGRYTEEKQGA